MWNVKCLLVYMIKKYRNEYENFYMKVYVMEDNFIFGIFIVFLKVIKVIYDMLCCI